ncbi:MAG: amidohydrolase [Rhodospirillaceae bacterium]|nr:amidohydrolase [Rhodospirillaceae bacterium]|tara:strand:+ start:115959 stop:116912 length:954 start_codon:yes stop_codon:yes gene_type:complete
MSVSRIDVHHHVLPEFYKDAQRAVGISGTAYRGFPDWTPEKSLALMSAENIGTAILSFTSPGIYFGDIAVTRDLAKQCNDYLAQLATDHPGRFGGFAFLPLPDIDASLREIERVLDVLNLDGITLLTSIDEKYIGHPDFEPIYEELNRRQAVTFIHPCYPPGTEAQGWDIPRMIIDYPFETTRVATNLIFKGVMERMPDIRFILSHSGGTLPFLMHRIAIFDKQTPFQDNYPKGAMEYVKRFYFDTALSGDKIILDGLSGVVDPSRILFGSDYPYVSEDVVEIETGGFDSYDAFNKEVRKAINRDNAEILFPRFAEK